MKKCLLRKASIGIYNEQLVLKCERYRTDSTHLLGKCKLTNPMLCYVQDMEFRLNIWFLEPPETRFQLFLVPDPKLLPEGFKNMARELFLDLDRISGFWTVQKSF